MAEERRTQEIEASPEEARFLRRFVRRTTLPWIASALALAGLALGVALSPPPPAALSASAPSASHASAAYDELRAELASLREKLAALESARSTEPASSDDDVEARLAKLEAELAARPASSPAAPAAESPGDLIAIRDRLYNLESHLDRQAQERDALEKDVLTRLYDVERSMQSRSTAESLPAGAAAPAPSEAPR